MIQKLSKYLLTHKNKTEYISFCSELKQRIKDKYNIFKSKRNLHNRTILETYVSFVLILILNQKDNLEFIKQALGDSGLLDALIAIGNGLGNKKDAYILQGMINSIFLEFKTLFFRNPRDEALETIYIQNQAKISQNMQKAIRALSTESYCNIFDLLLNLGIDYDNLDTDSIDQKDLDILKKKIIRCIIRVMFSKEKYIFIRKDNLISTSDFEDKYSFSEYNFLNKVIYKDLLLVKQQCGDKPEMIFKKGNLFNDILKEIFYFYGNETIIHAFIEPFSNLITNLEGNNNKINKLDEDNFEIFINDLISNLKEYLPQLLKLILKLIYQITNELFSSKSLEYYQILYFMFFSFLCSDKVLEIFEVTSKYKNLIVELQKVLNVLISNSSFPSDSQYSGFGSVTEIYFNRLKTYVKQNIIQLDENSNESKIILKYIAMNNELKMPKFLFYVDCQNIMAIAPAGFIEF